MCNLATLRINNFGKHEETKGANFNDYRVTYQRRKIENLLIVEALWMQALVRQEKQGLQ